MVTNRPACVAASCVAFLVACTVTSALAAADTYAAVLAAYRDYDRTAPARLLALPPTEINEGGHRALTPDDLRAAAMLHTDAAMLLLGGGRPVDAFHHLGAATGLLDALPDSMPARDSFIRRWYSTVTALLRLAEAPVYADDFAMKQRKRFQPHRADIMLQLGRQAERAAGAVESLVPGEPPAAVTVTVRLTTAGREYEQALAMDGELHEASLHLGRVRMLLGRYADALGPLEHAERSPERRVAYLALLYRGALAEYQGDLKTAEDRYRDAVRVFRWGQSAPFALAQVQSRAGRERDAGATVATHLASSKGRVVDPLWMYLFEPSQQPNASLAELRAEVWR